MRSPTDLARSRCIPRNIFQPDNMVASCVGNPFLGTVAEFEKDLINLVDQIQATVKKRITI